MTMTPAKPKLEDVAKVAGVSPTTVSRVLNKRGYISQATHDKVHQAIEAIGYFPNEVARSLHGHKTKLIGLLFPNVTNPFYGEMVTHIENLLSAHGYKVLICNTDNNVEKETDHLRMLLSNQVDGIIVGSRNQPSDLYQKAVMASLPVIAIDRYISDDVINVRSDNYQGACLATQYLLDQGCKHIGLFIGSPESEIERGDLRLQGHVDTLLFSDRKPLLLPVAFGDELAPQQQKIKAHLLANPQLDGVFATGDTLAGMVSVVGNQLNHPLEIVGYDGTETFLRFCGGVSTIQQPMMTMAERAVEILLAKIDGTYADTERECVLPVVLMAKQY